MGKRFLNKTFVCFVSFSVALLTGQFHQWVAEAHGTDLFIGAMVSRGEVKFEERKNVWQQVEPSYFPISTGMKIKTGEGLALITLTNKTRIRIDQNSLLSFGKGNRLFLTKGLIDFWIPSTVNMDLEVGNLSVTPSRAHQATKGTGPAPSRANGTTGSIYLHANGQVTVKSAQGNLTILNQNREVTAALSSKGSITIPSTHSDSIKIAQVDDEAISEKAEKKGLSTWTWAGIGTGVIAIIAGAALLAGGGGGGDHEAPACP